MMAVLVTLKWWDPHLKTEWRSNGDRIQPLKIFLSFSASYDMNMWYARDKSYGGVGLGFEKNGYGYVYKTRVVWELAEVRPEIPWLLYQKFIITIIIINYIIYTIASRHNHSDRGQSVSDVSGLEPELGAGCFYILTLVIIVIHSLGGWYLWNSRPPRDNRRYCL